MDIADFERCIDQAVKELPPKFKEYVQDVVFIVEDKPKGRRGRGLLLGLYEGVPLTELGREYSGKLPDTIYLYRENIEQVADDPEDVPRVIRETVLHEIGHHFGLDHDRIGKMEQRWHHAKKKT